LNCSSKEPLEGVKGWAGLLEPARGGVGGSAGAESGREPGER
jgi:hypothetical protein